MSLFAEILERSRQMVNRGEFRRAFNLIADQKVTRPDQLYAKTHLMVDTGIALRDIKVLEYCLYLMERHAGEILSISSYVPYHWLNCANIRSNILAVRESEGGKRCWYDRSYTLPARQAYAKAAENAGNDHILQSQILCAHARVLVGLGRDREAFLLFHRASVQDADNTDAQLGRLETLSMISGTAPVLEKVLLQEAGGRLQKLETKLPGSGWNDVVNELKTRIKSGLGQVDVDEPNYPRNTVEADSERGYKMMMYALKHKLYLTPCSGCCQCDRAIGDSVSLAARHAVVGSAVIDNYRRKSILIGRMTERYRALRAALINHALREDIPDGAHNQSALLEVVGYQPLNISTVGLSMTLAGVQPIFESMVDYIAIHLELDVPPSIDLKDVLGEPGQLPKKAVLQCKNPALHAFWDLWSDGMGKWDDFDNIQDHGELTEKTLSFIRWIGDLLSYLVEMSDREGQSPNSTPELWPLQPFVLP